jgi:alkylation response protein AidB-like acyl-CoA dehydrogenase
MDFDLTEDQRMFQKTFRNFVEKEIAPLVEQSEASHSFPVELFPKLGKNGYLCVHYSEKYGGSGADKVTDAIWTEEIARVSTGFASSLSGQMLGSFPIYAFGTEEQKQKYIPLAVSGEKIFGFALTEPNAGSDAASITTTVRREGDTYILNGTKMFTTNGTIGDYIMLAATTDRTKGMKGIALFLVERGMPGFNNTKRLEKLGIHSSDTAELVLEDCRLPRENLIGEEQGGFPRVMEALNQSRINVAALAVGTAQAAFEASLKYAQERVQFGQPIAKFQINRFKLARMAMLIEAARLLVYKASWLCDQGRPFAKEASMAKLFATEAATRITGEAVQIHGGYGYMVEYPVERYFRDAKVGTIYEGTSEIQHEIIAKHIGV